MSASIIDKEYKNSALKIQPLSYVIVWVCVVLRKTSVDVFRTSFYSIVSPQVVTIIVVEVQPLNLNINQKDENIWGRLWCLFYSEQWFMCGHHCQYTYIFVSFLIELHQNARF